MLFQKSLSRFLVVGKRLKFRLYEKAIEVADGIVERIQTAVDLILVPAALILSGKWRRTAKAIIF